MLLSSKGDIKLTPAIHPLGVLAGSPCPCEQEGSGGPGQEDR
jgi:hypothetical protein